LTEVRCLAVTFIAVYMVCKRKATFAKVQLYLLRMLSRPTRWSTTTKIWKSTPERSKGWIKMWIIGMQQLALTWNHVRMSGVCRITSVPEHGVQLCDASKQWFLFQCKFDNDRC